MSRVLFLLVLALWGGMAYGQVQEKRAAERILGVPDQTLNYDLRKSSFGSSQKFSTSNATVKNFTVEQRYTPKAFGTKQFAGSQSAWMGDLQFSTKEAKSKEFAEANKTRETQAALVNESQYANRSVETHASREMGRNFFGKGRSQDLYDAEGPAAQSRAVGYTGDLKPMTIDDIRTLLNKNK